MSHKMGSPRAYEKLIASDISKSDNFGISVAINGNFAVAGAPRKTQAGTHSGSAYVFERNGGAWSEVAKLVASDMDQTDEFGISVSINGSFIVIGAHNNDDAGSNSGSAYVFQNVGNVWSEIAKLVASDAADQDRFGASVSIKGDYVVIGASEKNLMGSAYIFERICGVLWKEIVKFTASDATISDKFGSSVGISSEFVISGSTGSDGNSLNSGALYLYSVPPPAPDIITPVISVTPTLRDFENVVLGYSKTQNIEIRNEGCLDLVVNGISLSGPNPDQFLISSSPSIPFMLTAGKSQVVAVTINPTSSGTKTATLQISSNAPNNPTVDVILTGEAFDIDFNSAVPGVCYASTGVNDGGRLIEIDPITGAGTPIANIFNIATGQNISRIQGLAINSEGEIFGTISTNNPAVTSLLRIDAITGEAIVVFTILNNTHLGFDIIQGIDFDENDILYGIEFNGDLIRINPAEATATLVGNTMTQGVVGLAFDPTDGTLYASGGDTDSDKIYKLDPVTAAATFIGKTGLGGATPDIHFDTDGNLFGPKGGGQSPNNSLISIDKLTALGVVVGPIGFSSISGLAFFNQTTIQRIDDLISRIDDIVDTGVLNSGQGNALIMKLNGVLKKIAMGHTATAINKLEAFIHQVQAYVNANILTQPEGQILIGIAQGIIEELQNAMPSIFTKNNLTANHTISNHLPVRHHLHQNYPNPFNPSTEIRFELPVTDHVVLSIFNTLGQEIRTLQNRQYEAGFHGVHWDGKDSRGYPVSNGVYIYRIQTGHFSQIKKMSLVQ